MQQFIKSCIGWLGAKGRPAAIPDSSSACGVVEPSEPALAARESTACVEAQSEQELGERLLAHGRYALLLRPQIASQLPPGVLDRAWERLHEAMALVPAGQVVVGADDEALTEGKIDASQLQRFHARLVQVEPVYLDRYAVTNGDYYRFVAAGGYEDLTIWDQEVWPAMFDFVDRSGCPGPRFWVDGCFPADRERHPVVGVCWYEAAAYARWTGKRLPTGAEWTKAGCWPVTLQPDVWVQRRFPWGSSFEPHRANIWATGVGDTLPVDALADGASAGGLHQLVGNVWEWTAANYGRAEDAGLMLPVPMKAIRGGAFDTYFEHHATCHFQSGESRLGRKHNVGFRLALGACDLPPEQSPDIETAGNAPLERECDEETQP